MAEPKTPKKKPALSGWSRLRANERRLALAAIVVSGSWVLVVFLIQPLWDKMEDLRVRVDTHTQKLQAIGKLFREAPSIEQEHQMISGYLQEDQESEPQAVLLNELEALARGARVQVNFKPKPMKQEESVEHLGLELDVEGSHQQIFSFLDALLRLPKLLIVERLRITAVPAKDDQIRANLILWKLVPRK
ncbi:MAG: type 4a pilus biogenesis protein PilO [Candidatus Omnitrophica bacterium]|nr:type 4a pilus biogenesis protein PilO [Candidatus Omnitrophota bacterium]